MTSFFIHCSTKAIAFFLMYASRSSFENWQVISNSTNLDFALLQGLCMKKEIGYNTRKSGIFDRKVFVGDTPNTDENRDPVDIG